MEQNQEMNKWSRETEREREREREREMVKQGWSEYYVQQFELQDRTDNDSGEEWTTCIQTAEWYVEPSNGVDLEMTISKVKKGRATGHDQILAELIKDGGK